MTKGNAEKNKIDPFKRANSCVWFCYASLYSAYPVSSASLPNLEIHQVLLRFGA